MIVKVYSYANIIVNNIFTVSASFLKVRIQLILSADGDFSKGEVNSWYKRFSKGGGNWWG